MYIIGLIVITVIIVITIITVIKRRTETKTADTATVLPTPTIVEEKAAWTDQSGFTFQYPKRLALNPHDEDKVNYAHVELTSATHSGNLIAWAKDTKAATIEDWVTQNKFEGAIDTTLGDVPAKKILNNKETKQIIIAAVNNGYLYELETNLNDDYWSKILDEANSSFKFLSDNTVENKNLNTPAGQGEDAGGEVESEEVVE